MDFAGRCVSEGSSIAIGAEHTTAFQARTAPVQGLAEHAETKFVKLDMMQLEDVEQLVCQRLGVRSVPSEVGKLIRSKSEGHPFFAEELAYAGDSGVLIIEGNECHWPWV